MTMTALLPLPKYLRASAQDAGNNSMRRANRVAWNEDDYDSAVATLDRLVEGCYGPGAAGRYAFQLAEAEERSRENPVKSSQAAGASS